MCEQFSCHIYFLYFIAQIARNPSYSFLSVNKQINPRNKKTQECILSFLFASLTLLTYLHINHIKLITNRWAWALVPTKLVDPGNSLAWGGGIHGNPASGPHQVPSHWTIQWNTYRPNTYLAHTSRGRRDGKNQSTNWHANSKLLQQHFAKNCKQATAYISHKVPPLEASGHPYYSWGNNWPALSTLRLTLPKLHLATLITWWQWNVYYIYWLIR